MEYKITKHIAQFPEGGPVRAQFEQIDAVNSNTDPLQEDRHKPCACIVHRYPKKVLFLVTQDCAAHCAFCTRQRLCGTKYTEQDINDGLTYIKTHTEIIDVLISGGDPLMVPEIAKRCLIELQSIQHVKWVRIGTRLPIVDPKTAEKVIQNFPELKKPLYINIHINHPDEITQDSVSLFGYMRKRGYILGSQSVILKGINDDVKTLNDLFVKITESGIRPYYAYVTDQVKGTERFWVSPEKCIELFAGLRGLSGLCLPKLVWDDSAGKVYLPEYITECISEGNTRKFVGIGFEGGVQTYVTMREESI